MSNYQTITSDRSKKVAFWLCLFGGVLGLHQFYVGRIGKGLFYLIIGGGFFIGFLIDLISIATGGFRDNANAPLRR